MFLPNSNQLIVTFDKFMLLQLYDFMAIKKVFKIEPKFIFDIKFAKLLLNFSITNEERD